jgi:ACS family D-galactonate transporter-like MFS transporter
MPMPLSDPQPTHVRWLIVSMLMGFAFLGHFNRVSISVAGNEKLTKRSSAQLVALSAGEPGDKSIDEAAMEPRDVLSNQQMGWVYSTFLIVYTLGMLPGGWVIDRLGPRVALTGMGLGMGFCVIATGVLGWLGLPVESLFIPLLLIRGVAGAVSVPLHPAAARSVSLWVPLSTRSTANGLVTAGALIGIAVTYPGFGWLMDRLDWPTAFVVCGTTMMLFSIVWYLLSADDAASHSWTNAAEKNLLPTNERLSPRTRASMRDFLRLFLNGKLFLLALSYAALSYFQYLFFYWIGMYFETELKLPVTESRRAVFTVTIAMAIGMAVGGIATDWLCRLFGRRWGCRAMAMFGMGFSALCAWMGIATKDPVQIVFLFSLALGALGLCEAIFWTTAPLLEKRSGGLACAFLNTVGNAGGLLAPIFTPWIGEHYGWTYSIAVASIVCGIGAVLWFWIDPGESSDVQPSGV